MNYYDDHDRLHISDPNLLDALAYEHHLGFLLVTDLREGDVITDGVGTYQVGAVDNWTAGTDPYIRHIRISHTLAGPGMGGLLRGRLELIHVLNRRRQA